MSSIKFCPKCHKEVYRTECNEDIIKITQGERTVLSMNKKSKVSMVLQCPNKHPVKLEMKPEERNDAD